MNGGFGEAAREESRKTAERTLGQVQNLCTKIVRNMLIARNVSPDPKLMRAAERQIKQELGRFLDETAVWVIQRRDDHRPLDWSAPIDGQVRQDRAKLEDPIPRRTSPFDRLEDRLEPDAD